MNVNVAARGGDGIITSMRKIGLHSLQYVGVLTLRARLRARAPRPSIDYSTHGCVSATATHTAVQVAALRDSQQRRQHSSW